MLNVYKAKPKASLLGKTFTFHIDDSDYEVHGISKYEQKIAFVSAALPGEKVQAKVLEDKAGFLKASTLKVLQASALRITPPCVYATSCGGCQLQHISAANQRKLKQQGIDKLIRHQTGLVNLPWQPMLTAADSGYRRRARIGGRGGYSDETQAASWSIKPISGLDISLSMSTRISMRSSTVPRPIM